MSSRKNDRANGDFQARKVEGSKVFRFYLEEMRQTIAELIAQVPPGIVADARTTQDEMARACYLFGMADAYGTIAEDMAAGLNAYYAKGHGLIAVASAANDDMAETLRKLRDASDN